MITDDDLLLYYYRDGLDADERTRIGAALAAQPELARRLHALVARLDAAAAVPEVPVPEHTQQRWRAALESAAVQTRATPAPRRTFGSRQWLAAAAAVVAVAIGVSVYRGSTPAEPPVARDVTTVPPKTSAEEPTAYEKGLKYHLASTERQLASLGDATPEARARLVETIISQNRMYALAAERAGEPQLARVLRSFTPILQDVADGKGESSDSDIAQLNFEMRVMQARLKAGAPSQTL
jgi:hypothetical protein